ncbi:MAG TPA: ribulose-phosphate 3-epimerase [Tissierellaceae bacterium]
MALLSPSLLSANFANLEEEIKKIEKGGADYIHLDVMDGKYVPNISFGMPVIKSIKEVTKLPFDVHLMIENPENYVEDFYKAGADIITVHYEATTHVHRTIQLIKSFGIKAGISLNPGTSEDVLKYIIDDLDLILVMSVNPGFGGQSFIPSSNEKIRNIRKMIDESNKDILLEVDGGIKLSNVKEVIDNGANMVVVGSDIYKAEDVVEQTKKFKSLIE